MPLDPNGPLTQYRQEIDINSAAIPNLAPKQAVLDNFVSIGYGGIGADGPVALPNLILDWATIEGWDQAIIASPVNIIQNFASSGLQVTEAGIYNVYVKLSLAFDESNGGREVSLRLFNQSIGEGAETTFDFFVGRNQAGVNMSFNLLAEVGQDDLNDLWVIQVSSKDGMSNVSNVGSIFQMNHVSEYKGII